MIWYDMIWYDMMWYDIKPEKFFLTLPVTSGEYKGLVRSD